VLISLQALAEQGITAGAGTAFDVARMHDPAHTWIPIDVIDEMIEFAQILLRIRQIPDQGKTEW
jgi:hypothetical protein